MCDLPRAAPKAMESLVGQSRVLRLAASPVIRIMKQIHQYTFDDREYIGEKL